MTEFQTSLEPPIGWLAGAEIVRQGDIVSKFKPENPLVTMDPIKILVIGDSNTTGCSIDGEGHYQYPWPRLLESELEQYTLRPKYTVVSDAVDGRTTRHDRIGRPGKNLSKELVDILERASPDIVVLAIGENDLNTEIHSSAEEVVESIGVLMKEILQYSNARSGDKDGKGPLRQLIVVAPPLFFPGLEAFQNMKLGAYFDRRSLMENCLIPDKLRASVRHMRAAKSIIKFANADMLGFRPGPDGLHMDGGTHYTFARSLAQLILNLPGAELAYGIAPEDFNKPNTLPPTPPLAMANLRIDPFDIPGVSQQSIEEYSPTFVFVNPFERKYSSIRPLVIQHYLTLKGVALRKKRSEEQMKLVDPDMSYLAKPQKRPGDYAETFQKWGPIFYDSLELLANRRPIPRDLQNAICRELYGTQEEMRDNIQEILSDTAPWIE